MPAKTVYQTNQSVIPPRVILFVLFLAMLWGGNAVSLKIGLEEFSPFASAGLRFTIGLALIAGWASANGISIKPQRHEYLRLFLCAILFITQITALNVGADFTRAGRTAVMTNTYPLFVALIAHFVVPGDHMTRRKALGLAFAFGGICFVFRDNFVGGTQEFLLGDLLTLLGGFLLGLLIVVTNRLIQKINTYCVLTTQMIIGVPIFFTLSAIFEGKAGYGFSFPALLAILYQGAGIAGFCFVAWTLLLKDYPPSRLSVLFFTTPLWGILLSNLLIGEPITVGLTIGAALVALGIYTINRAPSVRASG